MLALHVDRLGVVVFVCETEMRAAHGSDSRLSLCHPNFEEIPHSSPSLPAVLVQPVT